MALPVIKPLHRFCEGNGFHPVLFPVFPVTDLIHHVQRIPALCIDRVIQADRALDCIHRIRNLFFRNPDLCRDLLDRRLLQMHSCIIFFRVDCLVCGIPQRPADTDRIIVPQIPSDLPDDHRYRIRRKFHLQSRIKVIYRFHQSDTADLKQVVCIFAAA